MPIYEYQCQGCNHELEKLQKIADEPLSVCPQCGQPQLKRKISAAGFRLKGGGWYETDFKSGSKKNLAGESASSGGDSKPAPSTASSSASSASTASTASTAGTSGT